MSQRVWIKKTEEEINQIIFRALQQNTDFLNRSTLGIPSSYLDQKVFNRDFSFVKQSSFISTLIQNPNHIGCHTTGSSEPFFKGTLEIERNLMEICAEDILKGKPDKYDGYVSSGGTESNIQAIWVYRNFFLKERKALREEICILCSEDTHYSVNKAANMLLLDIFKVRVEESTRKLTAEYLSVAIQTAKRSGKKYFIVICNLMTTMFGSIDDAELITELLEENACEYKVHVDGAYGGFYYPFVTGDNPIDFQNKKISSYTMDGHKMAQAPYGTGIFIIEKNLIEYVCTEEAKYVEGQDYTLTGSRSGANAIALWMILARYGPYTWEEKILILQNRTRFLCEKLEELKISFYRHPKSNVVAIKSSFVKREIVKKFGLVPDDHNNPSWYKIVVMEHVSIEKLSDFLEYLSH